MFQVAVVCRRVIEAVQAAGAGRDLIQTVLSHLVDVLRIHAERTVHHQEVDLALFDGGIEQIGGLCGIVIRCAADRDADSGLDLRGDVEVQTDAGVVPADQTLEVPVKVEALAVAVEALKAAAGKVEIAGKLGDVLAAGSDPDMQAVRTCLFHLLRDGDGLFDGVIIIVVAKIFVVLFHAVDENLNDEVLAAGFFQTGHNFRGKLAAAVQRLWTIFIGAVVAGAGEEGLAEVVGGKVQLESVETVVLKSLADADDILNPLLDGVGVIVAEERLREVQRTDGCAHGVKLIPDGAACGMEGVDQPLDIIGFQRRFERTAAGDFPDVGKVFDPDHLHAAVGHALVVVDVFIGVLPEKSQLEGGGLHHAVVEGAAAELPVGEERRLGEIRAGIGVEIGALGIDDLCAAGRSGGKHHTERLGAAGVDAVTNGGGT